MKIRKMLAAVLTGAICVSMASCGKTGDQGQPAKPQAETAKQAILVVSFGTSYNETREATIGAVEKEISASFPDYDVRRAFTSQTIIDKLKERDGEEIDNVAGAMDKLVNEQYSTVIVQPTHIMNGYEYDEMTEMLEPYRDKIEKLAIGKPMLSSEDDYDKVTAALAAETPDMTAEDTAVVFVGHGTEHEANASYAKLGAKLAEAGYTKTFVGTVEAKPDMDDVKTQLAESGVSKVTLLPLMIVAGDHATNDICGDEEGSWYTELKKEGYEVSGIKKGLGEYAGLRSIFVDHVKDAIAGVE